MSACLVTERSAVVTSCCRPPRVRLPRPGGRNCTGLCRRPDIQRGRHETEYRVHPGRRYGLRRCVVLYGRRDLVTPNIDRLATEGLRFTQAYANSAVCTASRVALITGRYQYRLPIGLEEPLARRNVGLPPEHPTLPSLLRKTGYETALVGKWHLGPPPDFGPLKSGYDRFWGFRGGALDYFTHKATNAAPDLWDGDTKIEQTGYLTDLLGDRAVDVIDNFAKASRPFLLSLHF